ncbi:DUF1617 family protein [Paenibacillus sp. GCM10027626]|uniref:DUF1617 family protein n=1 Tax=Paenibacillus sp. GCM10027626 TaxID=3273411 RepID=UPI0036280850
MKLLAYELNPFIEFLYHLKLAGKTSRMRSRLLAVLSELAQRHESEVNKLVQEYAEKDEQGKPFIVEEEKGSYYKIANMEQFNKEYQELAQEEIVLDLTAERRAMLECVRDAVLDCEDVFEGDDAIRYNRWCDIVEAIQYEE